MELDRAMVERAFKSLAAVPGLKVEDWMLMQASEGDVWNGTTLYHFKNRDSRLYVYVPSRWGFQDEPLRVADLLGKGRT